MKFNLKNVAATIGLAAIFIIGDAVAADYSLEAAECVISFVMDTAGR
tara:strand:- start:545 stop:685 length:141 start_codon:yes stop_codon:yes gene_type:complete